MAAIKAVRNVRTEKNVPNSKKAKLIFVTTQDDVFGQGKMFFEKLCSASETVITNDKSIVPETAVTAVVDGAEIAIPLDDLVNKDEEIARLKKEQARLESEVKRASGKLNNPGFVQKAPAKLIEEEKGKLLMYEEMLNKIKESLAKF